ncbi:MAG: hypothetical protein ACI4JK_02135 [Oscillospiraceae bacterium]
MAEKEYIEREAVINSIKKMRLKYQTTRMYRGVRFGIDSAINYIIQEPAADVIPVVRCKDCKHLFQDLSEREAHLCMQHRFERVRVNLDDFCSYGEKGE